MLCRHLGAAALLLLCAGPVLAEEAVNPDPWERFNRKVFAFNDKVDRYFFKPVAKGYRKITPALVDDGITNFFNNLGEPVTIVNDLLQGKVRQSAQDTGRFVVNSTVGIAGLIDVARRIDLPRNDEDFGQTFAKWGLPAGPYVVVPFMYGMSVRDGVGMGTGGYMTSRLLEDGLDLGWREELAMLVLDVVDIRADLIPMEESLQMQGDRYRLIRDAWMQRRQFLINDGAVEEDPFLDDDYDEDNAGASAVEGDDGAAGAEPEVPATDVDPETAPDDVRPDAGAGTGGDNIDEPSGGPPPADEAVVVTAQAAPATAVEEF
ncbi:MAG: VacJ family lipoprotein [Gammaproteobacteria bacterium]